VRTAVVGRWVQFVRLVSCRSGGTVFSRYTAETLTRLERGKELHCISQLHR
jgi:hypothetical protein